MKRILILMCVCTTATALAQLQVVVVPNEVANVEGNSSANDFLNAPSFRMQMVFDASQFTGLGGGPGISNSVNSLWFRLDGTSTFDVNHFFGGASVTLSTTTRTPDSLSPVFADNVGANPVTIYNGALAFGAAYQPGLRPQPFALNILATTPFYYSPSGGNLLVDIIAGSGQVLFPGALDAQLASGDPVSRVFANAAGATAGSADTLGLVTRFNITVIPEPATWLLVMTGLTLLTVVRRR